MMFDFIVGGARLRALGLTCELGSDQSPGVFFQSMLSVCKGTTQDPLLNRSACSSIFSLSSSHASFQLSGLVAWLTLNAA